MKFHEVLAQARRDVGMTQAEMALRLDKLRGHIAHIEQGRVDVKLSTIERWLEACGLQLHTKSTFRCPVCQGAFVSDSKALLVFTHKCSKEGP